MEILLAFEYGVKDASYPSTLAPDSRRFVHTPYCNVLAFVDIVPRILKFHYLSIMISTIATKSQDIKVAKAQVRL